MKALQYDQPGSPDVLQYVDVPDPQPGVLDVVVQVAATSLNHLDVVQRNGWFTMPGYTLPHIAGMDVVGTVVEVGSGVEGAAVGDRVVVDPSLAEVADGSTLAGMGDLYGELGVIGATVAGGYAERCLVPASHVHRIPDAMSWHQAVCFPTAWMTAWHALFPIGRLAAGETMMVHAAGSGVSMAAIQLAKHAGATVLATAGSDDKCEKALALGADHVLNNRTEDVTGWAREVTQGAGVDMVFDHVGPALWAQSMFSIAPRGRLVNCGNTTGDTATIPSLGFMFHMGIQILGSDPYRYAEFAEAWQVYTSGSFVAAVDSVFALAEGAEAHRKMERSDFFGKILLEP
ncbi:MAG: zinc-binding dehydrogenase [Acidimicrobiales bacterium]